ncbi:hypothetical protein B9T31_01840 [Acinetobacter sp. ANC 4558]|uniref:alpha/beta hydrolase n=1 Tax=Acinetobacter sp. ANC 4558 TaxID=1977876 RepID=UPI000A35B6AB|nr:alpha/beta hydrolase-fold protein [Acinetobacter sp. ANC 4558]OTG88286.1 hypothetical protein B9T31_01840 [Acinetobacter sp. ANC 4558]
MFKKASLWLAFGLITVQISTYTLAQSPINIGEMHNISSSVLDEKREIQIYLPPSYEKYANQHYPVIYLLDGESNFHYLTGFVEKLSKSPYPAIPEMIVVGIVNTDRSRDLTPTVQKADSKDGRNIDGKTGGNLAFFSFLETELMPDIEKKYRTNGLNVFIGHSFGGITALNHMLNGHRNMQAYIVHDPSIWWDNEVMLKRFQNAKSKDFHYKKLFLTQTGSDDPKNNTDNHFNGIQRLNHYLSEQPLNHLSYKYAQYEDENHGSVPLKGSLDGLRYVFKDMQVNIRAVPENPNLVKEQYAQFSKSINYDIQPSEPYLESVLNYLKRSNNPKAVQQFQNYILSIYPQGNLAKSL